MKEHLPVLVLQGEGQPLQALFFVDYAGNIYDKELLIAVLNGTEVDTRAPQDQHGNNTIDI